MDKNELARKVATLYVLPELERAMNKFPALNSGHEAYAVILEELDEYWDLVKTKEPTDKFEKIECNENKVEELVQVAAMAIRAIVDLHFGNVK